MTCFNPRSAYESKDPYDMRIKFSARCDGADLSKPIQVSCGKCIGCLKTKRLNWAIRCMNEASSHTRNCVLNLTFNDKNLPENRSLSQDFIVKFIKKLRDNLYPNKIRYFVAGEYGKQRNRPHYHMLVFGYDFMDKYLWLINDHGTRQYRSNHLEQIWTYGYSTIGEVNMGSCQYIAGYLYKKLHHTEEQENNKYYELTDPNTGQIYNVMFEFATMSRNPGIGNDWYYRIGHKDCKKDYLVNNGHKIGVPRYYRELMKITDNKTYERNKRKRRLDMEKRKKFSKKELQMMEKCEKHNATLFERKGALNA